MTREGHVVVAGAGMAGLLTARALSPYVGQVTVVDRDPAVGSAAARRGVPQGRHLHVLLCRGLRGLEGLLPGVTADLRAAGAVTLPAGAVRWRGRYGWHVPVDDPDGRFDGVSLTRPLLESVVAGRVAALPNVRVLAGTAVGGLVWDGDRVVGARTPDGTVLPADLVVDATGRAQGVVGWLAEQGRPVPRESRVDPRLAYASRVVAAPEDALGGARLIALLAPAGGPRRSAIVAQVEGGRWVVSACAAGDVAVPGDDEGFRGFVAGLGEPLLAALVRDGVPVTDVTTHRGTVNRRRFLEELEDQPAGLLAVGDAVCALNPSYGQGMTLAVLQAEQLQRLLAEGVRPARLARPAYGRFAVPVSTAWGLSTGTDLTYAETEGERPRGGRGRAAYVAALDRAACRSAYVRGRFLAVSQMLEPPRALLAPGVLARVARHGRPGPTRAAVVEPLVTVRAPGVRAG